MISPDQRLHNLIETIELADHFTLSSAYPNPFNPQTRFTLSVKEAQEVSIAVYDLLGREKARLHEGLLDANETHTFAIDGTGWPSGLYVYRVSGKHFNAIGQVMLVK